MRLETLQSLVARWPVYGNRPAVGLRQAFGVRWWSYRRLYQEAYQFAEQVQGWGIAPGSRILLWAANCPEWVAAFFGAALRGLVVVPVDEKATLQHVRQLAGRVQAELLLHGPEQDVSGFRIPTYSTYKSIGHQARRWSESQPIPVDPDAPAVIMYTSGTTLEPKGVVLTHRNLISQLQRFDRWRWLLRFFQCRLLALSPLSHVQGLLLGACFPLSIGLSTLYTDAVDPAHVMRTIKQNRVTMLLAVPRVQHLLAQALRDLPYGRRGITLAERVRTVRFFPLRRHILFLSTHARLGYSFWLLLVGGAILPPADERFWYECGYILAQGYGLTETAALVSIKVNSPFFGRLGSIGKPLAAQQVWLADDGELLVRGANVSPGYFHDEAASRVAFQDGFLRTGDLVRRDQQNRFYFVGRKNDTIVTSEGHNVYPREVEVVLNRLPDVRDAIVLGFSQDDLTEVHAVLLLERQANAPQIITQANGCLEPYQQIRSWTVWPDADFPRTGLLKVKRDVILHQVQELQRSSKARIHYGSPVLSLDEIVNVSDRRRKLQLLTRYLTQAEGERLSVPQFSMAETLGLSSLDIVELLALIEKERSATFAQVSLTRQTTLAELQRIVNSSGNDLQKSPLPARQPWWSRHVLGPIVRRITQPFLIGLWSSLTVSCSVQWLSEIMGLEGPIIIAVAPHRHWLDAFVVYSALPRTWRRRLMVLTNRDFSEYFAPDHATRLKSRLQFGLAYYLLLPIVFSFVMVPNYGLTREGLYEMAQMIEAGYSPITFPKGLYFRQQDATKHEPGVALMALQTQVPILPIWLNGNDHLCVQPRRPKPHVRVKIGELVPVTPSMTPSQVVQLVETAFEKLAARHP